MAKHFIFADFVEEFKVKFTVYDFGPGEYNDAGKWIKGSETSQDIDGIILPASPNSRKNDPNGTHDEISKKIYTVIPLKIGQVIEYEGSKLTIDSKQSYSEYADVYIYTAKGDK